jgi:hypothetical protein
VHVLNGSCHCGNIRVELCLTRAPESYEPRVCDCGFCTRHGAAYVSDPHGSLEIRIGDDSQRLGYRQGTGRAQMLLCARCGVLVGALHEEDRRFATVNANIIDDGTRFGKPKNVSPQTLPEGARIGRWQELWFADVRVTVTGRAR